MATHNVILKNGGIATKLVVSHQLLILGNKTKFGLRHWPLPLDQINRLTNLNINENLTNELKLIKMINNSLQPQTIITPPLLYGFISSLILI